MATHTFKKATVLHELRLAFLFHWQQQQLPYAYNIRRPHGKNDRNSSRSAEAKTKKAALNKTYHAYLTPAQKEGGKEQSRLN